jgi:hypothetical protein
MITHSRHQPIAELPPTLSAALPSDLISFLGAGLLLISGTACLDRLLPDWAELPVPSAFV